jgi:hypothetical protein
MFIQRHFILLLTTISSSALAAIYDEAYIARNGPFGLIFFKKNDTFIDWLRVPEVHYKQWIYAVKVWRTVRKNPFFSSEKIQMIFFFSVLLFSVYSV